MPNGTSINGQFGIIPDHVLKQKFEVTNIGEDIYATDNFMRDIMTDFDCDAPYFESDQPRRDTHAEEFLSLRHNAHRTGEIPDAPDLFLELTEREPRGISNDPNFRLMQEQSWSRAPYFKFYPDSDNSVTEREKRPQTLIAQIHDQFENIKARLKIFSTSKDFGMSGKNFKFTSDSVMQNIDIEQEGFTDGKKITSYTATPRADLVVMGSNILPLGWDTTSDLEFKVAHYGHIRHLAGAQDVPLQRHDVEYDTAKLTEFQDQVVTVGLSQVMKRVAMEHHMRYDVQHDQEYKIFAQPIPRDYMFFLNPEKTNKASNFVGDQDFQKSTQMVERFLGQLQKQTGMKNQDIETQLSIVGLMDAATMQPNDAVRLAKIGRDIDTLYTQTMSDGTQTDQTSASTKVNKQSRFQNLQSIDWKSSLQVANLGQVWLADRKHNSEMQSGRNLGVHGISTNISNGAPKRVDPFSGAPQDLLQRRERLESGGGRSVSGKGLRDKFTVRDNLSTSRQLNAIANLS